MKTPSVSGKKSSISDFTRRASCKAACKRLKFKTLSSEINDEYHKYNFNTNQRSVSTNQFLCNAATNSPPTQIRAPLKMVEEDIANEHKTNKKIERMLNLAEPLFASIKVSKTSNILEINQNSEIMALSSQSLLSNTKLTIPKLDYKPMVNWESNPVEKNHNSVISSNSLILVRNQTGPSTRKNKTVGVFVGDNLSEPHKIYKTSESKLSTKPLSQNSIHTSVFPLKTNEQAQLVGEDHTEGQVCKILPSRRSIGFKKNPVDSRTLELDSGVVAFSVYNSSNKNEFAFKHRTRRFCTSSSNAFKSKSTSINEWVLDIKTSMFKVSDLPKLVVMPLLNSQQEGNNIAKPLVTPLSQNEYLSKSHSFVPLRKNIQSFGWLHDEKHTLSHSLPEADLSYYQQANVKTSANLLSEVISLSVVPKRFAKSSEAQYRIFSTSISYVYTGEGSRSIRFLLFGKSSRGLL